jgi:hypothetical protein
VSTPKIFCARAGFTPPESLRYIAEFRLVHVDNADVTSQTSAQVVNLDDIARKVSAIVVLAIGDVPMVRQVGSGGFGACEYLLEQVIIVGIAAPKLGAFQPWHKDTATLAICDNGIVSSRTCILERVAGCSENYTMDKTFIESVNARGPFCDAIVDPNRVCPAYALNHSVPIREGS